MRIAPIAVAGILAFSLPVFAEHDDHSNRIDREYSRQCEQTIGANSLNDPNSLRFCDWYGDLYQNLGAVDSIPYRNEFKLQGNVPLPYRFELSFSLYSDPVYNTTPRLKRRPVISCKARSPLMRPTVKLEDEPRPLNEGRSDARLTSTSRSTPQ